MIMFNLLESIEHLHSNNIMHRDIKPDNIILRNKKDNTSIVLVDFGLATYTNVEEYIFKRCGTPGFAAPEVINGSSQGIVKYSSKCDIFSVGCLFY